MKSDKLKSFFGEFFPTVDCLTREDEWELALYFPAATGSGSLECLENFWNDCIQELVLIDQEYPDRSDIPERSLDPAVLIKLAVRSSLRFEDARSAIRHVFEIVASSAKRGPKIPTYLSDFEPITRFPATLREFSQIGAYKDRFTASRKLRQFFEEAEQSALYNILSNQGLTKKDWDTWADSWVAWSHREKQVAKSRSGRRC